jgi:tocopherol O-methyltransferase
MTQTSRDTVQQGPFSPQHVAQYYRETRWQYRGLWTGKKSLALHYGYWADGISNHVDALHKMNEILADKVSIRPGELVLDAGCGWGGSAIWLAQHRGARAHGINIEAEQVAKAQEKARLFGVEDSVTFSVQDYTRTNFADAAFDVVWAIESVCYSRDKRDFLREAHRILKPGGRLVVADFFRARRTLDPRDERRIRTWLAQWIVDDLDTPSEFGSSLSAEGFSPLSTEDATERILPSSKRLFTIGLCTSPLALLFRLLPFYTPLQHANWKSSILQYTTVRRGLWRYGIFAARKAGVGSEGVND